MNSKFNHEPVKGFLFGFAYTDPYVRFGSDRGSNHDCQFGVYRDDFTCATYVPNLCTHGSLRRCFIMSVFTKIGVPVPSAAGYRGGGVYERYFPIVQCVFSILEISFPAMLTAVYAHCITLRISRRTRSPESLAFASATHIIISFEPRPFSCTDVS